MGPRGAAYTQCRSNSLGADFAMISHAELDRLIAEFRTHPLAEGELREVKGGVFVSFEPIAAGRSRIRFLPEFGRTNALLLQEGSAILQLRNIL